jgi:hypothetical protein
LSLVVIQNTNSQYNLPAIGKKIAYKANRDGVAERFADPAVQKSIEVDLARITYYDALLRDVELSIVQTARHHDAHTLYLLQTVPGIGKMLSLVLLYAIHDMARFPRVQDCLSSCRLVKWARESAGKRDGTSGTKIGNAHRKWAFAEAAVLFLRDHSDWRGRPKTGATAIPFECRESMAASDRLMPPNDTRIFDQRLVSLSSPTGFFPSPVSSSAKLISPRSRISSSLSRRVMVVVLVRSAGLA